MAAKKQTSVKNQNETKETKQNVSPPLIEARIDKLINRENSNIKAIASVNISGAYAVHGIKVIDSQKGLFVSMPSNSYTDAGGHKQFSDVCHPITAEARTELISKVQEAYEQALEEQQSEGQAVEESETEEEDHSMTQQM